MKNRTEYKAIEVSDYRPAKGAIVTFMFTFYFSFWNLPFHLLQFFELSAKPSWLGGNIGIDTSHKTFLYLLNGWRSNQFLRRWARYVSVLCKTSQSTEVSLLRSCFGDLTTFCFLTFQPLLLVKHAKFSIKKKKIYSRVSKTDKKINCKKIMEKMAQPRGSKWKVRSLSYCAFWGSYNH